MKFFAGLPPRASRSIVVHSEDPYGFGIADVFRTVASEKNISVLATVSLPTGDSDDSMVATRIANAAQLLYDAIRNPNAKDQLLDVGTFIYLGSSSTTYVRLLRECEKKNLTGEPYLWLSSDGGARRFLIFAFFAFSSRAVNLLSRRNSRDRGVCSFVARACVRSDGARFQQQRRCRSEAGNSRRHARHDALQQQLDQVQRPLLLRVARSIDGMHARTRGAIRAQRSLRCEASFKRLLPVYICR